MPGGPPAFAFPYTGMAVVGERIGASSAAAPLNTLYIVTHALTGVGVCLCV